MVIPIYIFGIIYLVGLVIDGIILFFLLYHMVRYGFFDALGKLNTLVVLIAMGLILVMTGIVLIPVDWSDSITILSVNDFTL